MNHLKKQQETQYKWDNSNKWDTGNSHADCIATDCDHADSLVIGSIQIPIEIDCVIKKLCKDIESEWQILLKCEVKDGNVVVDGYYIPKQEVTGATVKNLDCIDKQFIEENRIIATMHSHSSMGCFFSSTDEEFTNMSLIDNHIVVNNKGEYKACIKYILPCGMTKFFETTMVVDYVQSDEIKIDGVENITKKPFVSNIVRYNNKRKGKNKKYALSEADKFMYGESYGMYHREEEI